MEVSYRFEGQTDELICELTEFMDKYRLAKFTEKFSKIWVTYLYNDLDKNEDSTFRIAFRLPGATRGCINLSYVSLK